jgi:predicted molibdopterin-dependent oxidoreductase YjgC
VAWGTLLPTEAGRDTAGIVQAASQGEIDVLFLVGVDPLRDFPDAALAKRALQNVRYKVVVDVDADQLAIYADAMLPAAPYLEKDGHYTDWEGRGQRLRRVRDPQGLARPEWEIFQALSEAMGTDMGLHSLDALHEEMGRLLATHEGAPVDGRTPPVLTSLRAGGDLPAHAAHPSPETREDGRLLLFTYPLLVDEGRLSAGAEELKEGLEQQAFVEVHPDNAARLGIADGATVRLRTSAGEASLPARISDGIAPGSAFVPWNQPGLAANTLLAGRLITEGTLEPAEAKVSA